MTQPTAPARPGIYARGSETVDAILKAALDLLIDEGAEGFTIRRIAARCGMKVGNVSYHFPRKEMLVQVLLDDLIDHYARLLDAMVRKPGLAAEEQLRRFIIFCLDDIGTKQTTHLFTELWALANHDAVVADRVRAFYERVHGVIGGYVADMNPALPPDDVKTVALYISATMEGATPFLGHGKPWVEHMPAYAAIAVQSLLTLARTATPQSLAPVRVEDQSREMEPA
ncbi:MULTISPECIES: TetR/AcrR family transcriptional regulator [unclassified Sphingobium]|uniref:TetR/AcrR family transcriptional regulator n=1 Tax=unclassified Sphingobium TaxID=2611147 RepID=UPI0035A5B2DF